MLGLRRMHWLSQAVGRNAHELEEEASRSISSASDCRRSDTSRMDSENRGKQGDARS